MPDGSKRVISVRGARENNLKNVDLTLPRDRLVVFTGVSGSGKSSLAFDTIYAEGQRRYVESLSTYARQFLDRMERPDVDAIEGLSPAIAIDQRSASSNPRSTVGTVTEVSDYLRLLFARVGRPHCPVCGRPIARSTVQEIVDALTAMPDGARLQILGPRPRDSQGDPRRFLDEARRAGFVRARIDGTLVDLSEDVDVSAQPEVEVVVDRVIVRQGPEAEGQRARIADSVEQALKIGAGWMRVVANGQAALDFSEHFACPIHGPINLVMEPRSFSFNSPDGACPTCDGLGSLPSFSPELVIPRLDRSIEGGAVAPWHYLGSRDSYYGALLRAAAEHFGIDPSKPLTEASQEQIAWLLFGKDGERVRAQPRGRDAMVVWHGIVPTLERFYEQKVTETARAGLDAYRVARICPSCHGARLRREALAVTVAGMNLGDVCALPLRDSLAWATRIARCEAERDPLTERELLIGRRILPDIVSRLEFLTSLGLGYITLDRTAATLSGGEAQRIRLATQIGAGLSGVLYILDEPSIGLHPVDTGRLVSTLERLRDMGNTVIVVEHEEAIIRAADFIVDIGPGAGRWGGRVVVAGPLRSVEADPVSVTGQFLSGRRRISVPKARKAPGGRWLRVVGAREHNLQNVTVEVPLGCFVAVTGVSGSGKSTLVEDVMFPALARALHGARRAPGAFDRLEGAEQLESVVDVDQSPIGRTPRSNPATYTGAFGPIRELFASTSEARIRGYSPGRFSFNVKGGRCEACQGDGVVRIEMQFLPDVFVPCAVCKGRRYNSEALEIRFKGKSIAEVLDMTVAEALDFFEAVPALQRRLGALDAIGLGYVQLGQPATTLSGGEAQRVKLAAELARRSSGATIYLLDEPTSGLHPADVERLLSVLRRLVEAGNTVLVVEHDLDVIKNADWIIELGPGAGDEGGRVVATGTPEQIAASSESVTGPFLRRALAMAPARLTLQGAAPYNQ